jgi:hypothetical protein
LFIATVNIIKLYYYIDLYIYKKISINSIIDSKIKELNMLDYSGALIEVDNDRKKIKILIVVIYIILGLIGVFKFMYYLKKLSIFL